MPQTTDIPKLSVPELRAQIEGGNADPQVVAANVERYRTRLAQATAVRDEKSIDILSKAIEEFTAAPPAQGVDPHIPDSPGSGPEPDARPTPAAPTQWSHALQKTMSILSAAGYGSVELVRQATDDQLLGVTGFGPAKLRQIRQAFPKE